RRRGRQRQAVALRTRPTTSRTSGRSRRTPRPPRERSAVRLRLPQLRSEGGPVGLASQEVLRRLRPQDADQDAEAAAGALDAPAGRPFSALSWMGAVGAAPRLAGRLEAPRRVIVWSEYSS